jgi:hypothetical protein
MGEQHLEQSADVLTRSFLNLNDIWKKYNPTYEQIYPIMRGKILPSLNAGWSFVFILNYIGLNERKQGHRLVSSILNA